MHWYLAACPVCKGDVYDDLMDEDVVHCMMCAREFARADVVVRPVQRVKSWRPRALRHAFMTAMAILLLLFVASPLVAGAAPASQTAMPDFDDIDGFVQSTMQERGVPGVALAIIHGDQVIHMRGFGVADASGRPVTPQTLFRMAPTARA